MNNIKSTGALFKNREATGSQPQYRGDFKMTQELLDEIAVAFGLGYDKVQLAAWVKDDKNGNKFFSLSVQPPYRKDKGSQKPDAERPQSRGKDELDSDIPF